MAQIPGVLEFVTGLHTGAVPVVVEVVDTEPALDATLEEVVEVSLTTSSRTVMLLGWAGQSADELDLGTTGSWRARYHLQDMEPARQHDTRLHDEPPIDRYLVQLWLAPPAPDLVLRRTSEHAAYWHRVHPAQAPAPAQATPALPPHPAAPEP